MDRNSDRLLSDILAESGEAGELREALLNRTLRQVKRQRTIRRVRRAGSVLLLLLPILLLVRRVQFPPAPEPMKPQLPYILVRTAPLPASALIETKPFTPSAIVASAPSRSVASITSSHGEERGYREIDDATLLALAGTNSAVLVRLGPHSAELVFASGTNAGHTD